MTTAAGQHPAAPTSHQPIHLGSWAWLVVMLIIVPMLFLSFIRLREPKKTGLRKQNTTLIYAVVAAGAGVLSVVGPRRLRPHNRTFPLIVAGSAILIISAIGWNKLFGHYWTVSGFRGDIFRKDAYNLHQPMYGRISNPHSLMALLPIAIGLVLAWRLCMRTTKRLEGRTLTIELMVFQVAMILAFAECMRRDGKDLQESRDVATFKGVADVMKNYVARQHLLPQKAQHYPPGFMVLREFETQVGWPHLIVFLATVLPALTLLPVRGLAKELGMYATGVGAAQVMYATSAGVLIFANVSRACLIVILPAIATWLLVRAMKRGELWAAMLMGLCLAGYFFFTFASYMIAILFALVTLLALITGAARIQHVLKTVIASIAVFVAFFAVLYLVSSFNIVACFREATRLHLKQTGVGFDHPARYLFRSTGGILAYLLSAGLPLSVLAYASLRGAWAEKVQWKWTGIFCIATTAAIVASGFSGMSFLETERIWLFFCAPLAIPAGFELARRMRGESELTFKGVVALALAFACAYSMWFDHAMRAGRRAAQTQPAAGVADDA